MPRRGLIGQLAVLLGGYALTACAAVDLDERARRIAEPAQLRRESLRTDPFLLTAFVRLGAAQRPIDIYIEGDGHAWISRSEPALDPTPRQAMALQMAARDPAANVVYLARPCQFTAYDPRCEPAYWTGKRYSTEVIAALDQAISHYAAFAPGQGLNLIGYSGGGTLAVLIAARRTDVASIRTVAGNLDVDAVMRLHQVSAMPQSVNPIHEADRVAAIPQIHFSGGADRVVPPSIAERFARAVGGTCVQTQVIAGMPHQGRWADQWPAMLAELPRCG
jgi:pimeloyl-ACP methyl ester carboxylesterase